MGIRCRASRRRDDEMAHHWRVETYARQVKDYPNNHSTRSLFIVLLITTCLVSQASCRYVPDTEDEQSNGTLLFERSRRQVSGVLNEDYESAFWLEPPPTFRQVAASSNGPAVDLVGINRRQHEEDHEHNSKIGENQMKWSEFVQSNIASVPERLIQRLPSDVTKQVLDTIESDASFFTGVGSDSISVDEDPDSASIERLTKSCLTVHVSSATPDQLNVTFHLYTRKNPKQAFILRPHVTRGDLLASTPIDLSKPIKWVTHGFHTDVDRSEWMLKLKDKILANEDANVILTDWRRGASPVLAFYPKAAANAHVVAKMIVKILRRIRDDINFLQLHLIGHSLGAHIMGFVGSAFTEEYLSLKQQQVSMATNNKDAFWKKLEPNQHNRVARSKDLQLVGRITACDPALPCFGPQSSAPNTRLSRTSQVILPETTSDPARSMSRQLSATISPQESQVGTTTMIPLDWTPSMWTHLRPDSAIIVEVMHSNPGVMGYSDPLGDFDFYPNGFDRQPGCDRTQMTTNTGLRTNMSLAPRGRGIWRRQLFNAMIGSLARRTGETRSRDTEPVQAGSFASTIEKFLKPIRDFFHGNTCSHHRSVEYMVESIYYENIPQDRKLDHDFVCQLVGYRCKDYVDFKKGFCFKCHNSLDCRAFGMQSGGSYSSTASINQSRRLSSLTPRSFGRPSIGPTNAYARKKFGEINRSRNLHRDEQLTYRRSNASISSKRALPTFNPYSMDYQPTSRNKYFFDTKPTPNFCLHHYHVYVKYRWLRVRNSVSVDGFRLNGSLGSLSLTSKVAFNRYNYQSYTALFTHTSFLGPIDEMLIFGENMRPKLIEYIEVSYMSNLDSSVRSLGSARLCMVHQDQSGYSGILSNLEEDWPSDIRQSVSVNAFVRCSSRLV